MCMAMYLEDWHYVLCDVESMTPLQGIYFTIDSRIPLSCARILQINKAILHWPVAWLLVGTLCGCIHCLWLQGQCV